MLFFILINLIYSYCFCLNKKDEFGMVTILLEQRHAVIIHTYSFTRLRGETTVFEIEIAKEAME